MRTDRHIWFAFLSVLPAAACTATATPPVPSTALSVLASSEFYPPLTAASLTIDGSGLTGDLHDNHPQGHTMWLSAEGGGGSASNNPAGQSGPAWLLYTFNQPYDLDELWVWNHNQQNLTDRGLRRVAIHVSPDGISWAKWGDVQLTRAPGTPDYPPGDKIALGGVRASRVLLTAAAVEGNYGSAYFGLSEVRFYGNPSPCFPSDYPVRLASPAAPDTSMTLMLAPRAEGWLGSDVIHSIVLSTTQTLWLFGDTLIGRIENGARAPGARFINNSIAIQDRRRQPPDGMTFYWGPGDTSFFPHQSGTPGNLYWPTAGVMVNGGLFVFCYSVISGLTLANTTLIHVNNPLDPPPLWQWNARDFGIDNSQMGFHSALYLDGDFLYMMGYDGTGAMVLGRMLAADLAAGANSEAMQFWVQGPGGPHWGDSPADLVPLFRPSNTETQIQYLAEWGLYVTMIYNPFTPTIYLTVAPALTGPWSEAACIYDVPEHDLVSFDIISYAVRPHPELAAAPGELVITYATNALSGLGPLFTQEGLQIYAPRVIRLRLEAGADSGLTAWKVF
ncbi:MAG: hypothetical protein Kow0059_11420 [Candidatus Sumerlaeia bacterium]